jgi:S-adenosylmethionine:tRNA ribosyltransferase-isomerase
LRAKGATFVTLTHAAGISSTGDPALDQRLPLDEPYFIPAETASATERAHRLGKRAIAIGTTVVRALEHSARDEGSVRAGAGVANQRIGSQTRLRVVDAILSGTHEAGSGHYELLRAFVADEALQRLTNELHAHEYLTHEFGDSVLIDRDAHRARLERVRTFEPAGALSLPSVRKVAAAACVVC